MIIPIIIIALLLSSCQYIPDYKFTTRVPDDLISGSYHHVTDNSGTASSRLDIYADGTYILVGEDSDEADLFPSERGTWTVTMEAYSVTQAQGKIVFAPEVPVIGYAEEDAVEAAFIWKADAYNGPKELALVFSSASIVYSYSGRLS